MSSDSTTSQAPATSSYAAWAPSGPCGWPIRTQPSAWWSTTPGSSILTPTKATPPSARSWPSAAAIRPTFSIPFCSESTGVPAGSASPQRVRRR